MSPIRIVASNERLSTTVLQKYRFSLAGQAQIAQIRQKGHEQVMDVLAADQRKEFEAWWNTRGTGPGAR